jgi:hypothetical protein
MPKVPGTRKKARKNSGELSVDFWPITLGDRAISNGTVTLARRIPRRSSGVVAASNRAVGTEVGMSAEVGAQRRCLPNAVDCRVSANLSVKLSKIIQARGSALIV